MAQDRYALARQVIGLLENELAAAGFELLDVRVFRGGGRLQLRIFVDTEAGIDLAGCTEASRTAGRLLEAADLVDEQYVIEVSSPGIRRPLRLPGHFVAHVGERVDLRLAAADRPRKVRGVLEACQADRLVLRTSGENDQENRIEVPFGQIREANLDPDFDVQALIQADRREKKAARRAERDSRRTRPPKRRQSRR